MLGIAFPVIVMELDEARPPVHTLPRQLELGIQPESREQSESPALSGNSVSDFSFIVNLF